MSELLLALAPRALLVLGFCAATVGAAGFGDPVEGLAWPLFALGLAAVICGGLLLRMQARRRVESGRGGALDRAGLAAALHDLALQLDALEADQGTLEPGALCRRIDALLLGPYFELGGRNEEYARVLGPGLYSRIWEGFAVSERLLARAWSMATDGHLEEALLELPRARQQLALAVQRADQE